ncbi:MAG: hypothetical protein QM582_04135 [Micropruina sp.]|uniref:hypothetical protein n=1 Tax=Micropruina sp. TaxID=2737536 RepID=UPI0039E5B0DD
MRTLTAAVNVVRDVVWLTIVQPVREGRPRTAGWPVGLRPIMISALTLYALLALAVVFAGPLRNAETLIVTPLGRTIPDVGAWLCIAGVLLALVLLQTAALHLPWWVKLYSLASVSVIMAYFAIGGATDPLLAVWPLIGLLALVVLTVVRWQSEFAWWEFVFVAVALAGTLFVPLRGNAATRGLNMDWRGYSAEGALQTLSVLAVPSLLVAGAALAQIAVTASFAGVAAVTRELPRRPLQVTALLLLCGAVAELVRSFGDPENAAPGWIGSALALAAIAALHLIVMAAAGRAPAWSDLDEDSTPVNYLVALGTIAVLLFQPAASILREVARVTGAQWLFTSTDAFLSVTGSDLTMIATRLLVCLIGLCITVPLARRGRPWAAMFLSSLSVLSLFQLLRNRGFEDWASNTVPQMSGLLLIALLLAAAVQLIGRRLTAIRMAALASGILLCLIYPHRAILDDPISALLGFSGIGAVLFGLIWRILTEGDITHEGTRRWPVPARVLLFCASALLGVTSAAFVTLTRSSGDTLDVTVFADSGDYLLGTPLFLTAVVGCLAIAVAPARRPIG